MQSCKKTKNKKNSQRHQNFWEIEKKDNISMDPFRVQSRIAGKDHSSRRHCKKYKVWQGGEKLGKNNESFPDKIFHHDEMSKLDFDSKSNLLF